jgi:hypothetical protein
VALDPRIIRVSIEVRGQITSYTDLAITAKGTKFGNPNLGECNITIANLKKEVTDFILTETTPFNRNRTPKIVTVEAGRESTGFTLLYSGNIFRSSISQPPDSILSIRALANQFEKGNIVARSSPANDSLSAIAGRIASDLGLPLTFEADEKTISNYSFTGAVLKQIDKLAEMASIDTFIDNGQMFVKNKDVPLTGKVRKLDATTGLIGMPIFTEAGARITFLYDSTTVLGGKLDFVSEQYPSLTGNYNIYKLDYDITNRDIPFYYTAHCGRLT